MCKKQIISLMTAAVLALSPAAFAQDSAANDAAMEQALKALDAQLPGTLINNPYDIQWSTIGSDKKESVVKSEGAPGGMAYRVKVKKRKSKPWDIHTRIPMTTSIAKDETILLSFWARMETPPKGKEVGNITVALQRNVEPYDQIFLEDIAPTREWKLYSVTGTASRAYSAEKTQLTFNLARTKQTIELGQFYIMSLGPNADTSKYVNN